ncbi:hypothetical protein [Geminisphaera colitermitum]|uniref:hypothetical protein n=1 Tax=Geminisphaera colitermitum TaxID=1148786 RepID=UPI000158CB79|nr:hypothetical protein [Geminisphaera colitermitum]
MHIYIKTSLVRILSALCAFLVGGMTAHAADVFYQDFDSYTAGAALPRAYSGANTFNTESSGDVHDGINYFTNIVQDTTNLFGRGTTNQYLRYEDTNALGGNLMRLSTGTNRISTQVGTLSFDFVIPSAGTRTGWGIYLGNGWPGSGNSVFGMLLRFNDKGIYAFQNKGASLATAPMSEDAYYTFGTAATLSIVFNSSPTAITYDGYTLASGAMDVWLGTTRIGQGIPAAGGKGQPDPDGWVPGSRVGATAIDINNINISFNYGNEFTGALLIDNFKITDTAIAPSAVPEPASAALFGGIGILVTTLVWKRHRAMSAGL